MCTCIYIGVYIYRVAGLLHKQEEKEDDRLD